MNTKETLYFKNGRPSHEYFIDEFTGEKNGLSKEWHPNGQLWKQCNYKNDMLDGLYYEYTQSGKLFECTKFSENVVVESTTYTKNSYQ